MFPVILKTRDHVPPAAALYYEVAESGVFQVRETPLYRAVTRVEGAIPGLLPQTEHVQLRIPPLPRRRAQDVLAFFAEVYKRYRAEAVVIMFFRAETREHRIGVPQQTIPGRWRFDGRWRPDDAIIYGRVDRPAGFVRLGTIHSHGDLPAYASHTDCADEQYEDGLHIVFGDFHRPIISVAASFVANGVRFALSPDTVVEPCSVPPAAARAEWMARVRRAVDVSPPPAPMTISTSATASADQAADDDGSTQS